MIGFRLSDLLLFPFLAVGLVLPSNDEFMLPKFSLQGCPVGCKG